MYRYNAFISYSHTEDSNFAPALQKALHRFAKPWYKLRSLRVFRDTTNLSVNPNLWNSIESALLNSEFLIYLASPAAAKSKWVQKELKHWMKHRGSRSLFVVSTDGECIWDPSTKDFKWHATNAIPHVLKNSFDDEPFLIDFRRFKDERLSLRHPEFNNRIATIAATLHGKEKDVIAGDDVRAHKTTLTIAWCSALLLVLLLLSALIFGYQSWHRGTRLATSLKRTRASGAYVRVRGRQKCHQNFHSEMLLLNGVDS